MSNNITIYNDDWIIVENLNRDALLYIDNNEEIHIFLYQTITNEEFNTLLTYNDDIVRDKNKYQHNTSTYIVVVFVEDENYTISLEYDQIKCLISENNMISLLDHSFQYLRQCIPSLTRKKYQEYYSIAKDKLQNITI